MDVDPITGLPKELGIFEEISKESQQITISIAKKKFGKKYTIVEGIDSKDINMKDITKTLKEKFACGGTHKNGVIELQGNYKDRIRNVLVSLGFKAENIIIK